MAIPFAHTLITIHGLRPQMEYDPDGAGYDAPLPIPNDLAVHVRASISLPSGKRRDEQEINQWVLRCDIIENIGLNRFDIVIDETTGDHYEVIDAVESPNRSLQMEHIRATLRKVKGLVSAGGNNDGATG